MATRRNDDDDHMNGILYRPRPQYSCGNGIVYTIFLPTTSPLIMVQPMEFTNVPEEDETEANHSDGLLMNTAQTPRRERPETSNDHHDDAHGPHDASSSHKRTELCFCLCLLLAGLFLEFLSIDPRQRPIPYQQLESTGDFIINQVNNQELEGDTISGKFGFVVCENLDCSLLHDFFDPTDVALICYSLVLPFCLQMQVLVAIRQ